MATGLMDVTGLQCVTRYYTYLLIWMIYTIRIVTVFSNWTEEDMLLSLVGELDSDYKELTFDIAHLSFYNEIQKQHHMTFKPIGRLGNQMYEYSSLIDQ